MRDLDDEIEDEKFHSDGESEGNLPLLLLSDLELETSDNSETEKVISAPRNKASHRSKRLVHDLESALSTANYNEIAEVKTQKLYTAGLDKQKIILSQSHGLTRSHRLLAVNQDIPSYLNSLARLVMQNKRWTL